ncbi:hypothetical protein CYLTODRAFT_416900 [Cylindrobasidium torrendii FP15055 ss-10]|uniref:Uncharacterized protein n=1 Tax=Cylindrobasidium torrendii FP15055 ss-10 TaxID=1314674 RepID=A0A0D7BTM0_9AGAR|nr:hypothetical protein CYLTODRAFT_416900 [Cylindrobasidium torrendii FP15055 ss-10]
MGCMSSKTKVVEDNEKTDALPSPTQTQPKPKFMLKLSSKPTNPSELRVPSPARTSAAEDAPWNMPSPRWDASNGEIVRPDSEQDEKMPTTPSTPGS